MLHKLALVVNCPEDALLEKLAIISREEHFKALKRDEQKALELAKLRKVEVPMKVEQGIDIATGKPITRRVPDIAGTRISTPQRAGTPSRRTLKTKVKTPRGTIELSHNVPQPTPLPRARAGKLRERAIREAYGDVSKSRLKQLRHRFLGPVKRFWSGANAFKNPWANRLALLGALGASGLGIKAYLDANQTPQIGSSLPPDSYGDIDPQMLMLMQQYPEAWKGAAYVQDIAATPRPTPQPKVTAPTTKAPSALAATARTVTGVSTGGSSATKNTSESSEDKISTIKKQAVDDMAFPLVAGGAGGVGGYMLAKKFLTPYLQGQEKDILREIAAKQEALKNLQKAQKYGPWGAAAAGAILLAALAAYKARRSEEQRQQAYSVIQNPIRSYDPSGAGYNPEEQVPFGTPPSFY